MTDADKPGPDKPGPGNTGTDHAGVIAHPPFLYAGALVAGAVLDWIVPLPLLAPGTGMVPGIALIAAALLLAGWCFRLFTKAGTNLPTNKPSTAIVTTGPYRLSRNPIYVALTTLSVGIALWVNSAWMLGLIVPTLVVMTVGVIRREEQYLEAKFGDDYRSYKARVRRWL
ncbi:MAG: isoprenylcysteine carboxylmethyltransferase family protein [Alphaproteobacteria bacterium]|nr:isoprenylcysteine carboxylmethyltransferase family protein [Alphaproteobacteria bacterium]